MEAKRSFETFIDFQRTAWSYFPEVELLITIAVRTSDPTDQI
jgi:hypothetical protein